MVSIVEMSAGGAVISLSFPLVVRLTLDSPSLGASE